MRLLLFHPEWVRSCTDCEKWLFNDPPSGDGSVCRRPARTGPPTPRPKGSITPCYKCPKIPLDAPARNRHHAQDMSPRNMLAYRHYLACKAVGWHVPEAADPIVMRNARIIRALEEAYDRVPLLKIIARLEGLEAKR